MGKEKYDHYYGIDWLRVIACIGIIMMHMQANNQYVLNGYVFDRGIPSFTNFVFLFMTISAFGMCCGYYDKVLNGKIQWPDFYKKRYLKILPFFSVLVSLDLVMGFSKESLFEAIADVSLLFGLFPNKISVIGVGWFLGVVFAFYLIFPFFCTLVETKKRAWLALAGSLLLNYIGGSYFCLERTNIVYSLCFFIAGGLIYLYRENIAKIKLFITLPITIISILMYYIFDGSVYCSLFVSAAMLICTISIGGGYNRVVHFICSISMEMYLSHMVIFRAIERLHLNTIVGNGIAQYIVTIFVVTVGTACFALVWGLLYKKCNSWMVKRNECNLVD